MTHPKTRPISSASRSRSLGLGLLIALSLVAFQPTTAAAIEWPTMDVEWEGTRAENVTSKTIDALVIRPLSTVRVVVGAVLLAPAAIFASPSGMTGIDAAYEVLLEQPVEYAFRRDLGEF